MDGKTNKLLLDAVYEWECNYPDKTYLTQPIGPNHVVDYSWSDTMGEARRMAAYLRSLDLPDNSNIALLSKNCAHFIMAELAIWMSGHATVALYPTLHAETVQYILDHSDSALLFVGKLDGWNDMKAGVPEGLPTIALPLAPANDYPKWDGIIATQEPISDSPSPEPDRLALICYTSGSTGRPKGVMHSFASASVPAQSTIDSLAITSDDRILSYLPLAHVFERAVVGCASFYAGFHIYFAESLDTFVADLHRARPTLFISVPRLWLKFQLGVFEKFPQKRLALLLTLPLIRGIVQRKVLNGLGLAHVRIAGSGSAPIPPNLLHWYDSLGLSILEGYGMSEDFACSHMSQPDKRRVGYVGAPSPGVKARITETGEIQIKSPGNMVGYFKASEQTAACYTNDGYFKTGDRGIYSDDGLLRITGRVKELFKTSKGKYIAPVPIENMLNADSHIELSCVSGAGRQACYAVIQLSENLQAHANDPATRASITLALEQLIAKVNAQIDEHEKVQFLAIAREQWDVANNFLTPTLKIRRSVIEDVYESSLDAWYDSNCRVIWPQ